MKEVDSGLGDLEERGLKFAETFAEAFSFAEITKSFFEAGEEFETAMSKIERSTGAAGEQLKGLENSFAATFGNVVQGADDVAGGLALLSQRTGATGEDLNKLLEVNSKLAQVLDQQLRPTIESTQKVFSAFKTAIEDQPEKLDALLAIAQKSGVSFNTLISGLQTMGPTLRALGLDITDSAALLANFEAQGISTGKVAGTLNATLVSLAKEGFVDPKAALGEFLQQIIEAKDPTEALQLAAENFKGKGLIPLVDALQNGAGNLAVLRDAAANSKGRIDETAKSTETLSEKFKLLEGSTTKLLAPLGVELVAALGKLVDAGTATVKFIDSIFDKADELDKKFGTDADHIKGYSEIFTIMAKVLAEKVVPGLKDASDAAANSKFLDGSMKDGLKTLSDMFPEFGKHVGDAQAKFVDLDKELKEAEKNLSEVEKSVRLGIGTDEDAAAARLKVVAAMQALHPEYRNIFAETDSWNSIIKISNDLIGEQNEALLKMAPTISAHTALLESQALSLQARARLWPIDIKAIQDQGAALQDSTDALKPNVVNWKELDAVMKMVNTGFKDELKSIQQTTEAFGPIHDQHVLGIADLSELTKRVNEANTAYNNLAKQGFASNMQEMEAHARVLQRDIDLMVQAGGDSTDLRIQLDQTTSAIQRQSDGWFQLYKNLNQVVTSDINTTFHDITFNIDKVGDDFKRLGQDIVTTIEDQIIKKALTPLIESMDKLITEGVKGLAGLLGIGTGGGGIWDEIFKSTGAGSAGGVAAITSNTTALSANTSALAALTTALGEASGTSAATSAGGAASGGGGSVASGIGGMVNVVSGVVTAVASVATAIGTFVEGGAMNDKLFKILNDTDRMDLILEKSGNETIFYYTKQTWQRLEDLNPIRRAIDAISASMQDTEAYLLSIAKAIDSLPDIKATLGVISGAVADGTATLGAKLDTINQTLQTGTGTVGGAAPQFKIFLDGRELLQSVVTALSQSGTVVPAV